MTVAVVAAEGGRSPGTEPRPPRRAGRLTQLLRWQRRDWADDHELAHAIHGTVVGAAAMAAASLHGTLGEVVVTVVVTILVYWAAERYARVLSAAAHGGQRLQHALAALRRGRPMIEAAYTPLVVLVVVYFLFEDALQTAVFAALITATLLLGGLGHLAARRAGTSRAGAIGWGAVSAALGVVVIVLKLSLH